MTEQLDRSGPGDDAPGFAASSYAADAGLLAELRASWPPAPATPAAPDERGFVAADLSTEPSAAIRLGDRFAVALIPEAGDAFRSVPLARDEPVVTTWKQAAAGDGLSAFVAGVPLASEIAIAVDQTNASVIVGDRVVVKWFRWIGPGPSRAATLVAHLDAVGFREMPAPLGSIGWRAPSGVDLTIAQGDAYLPGAVDGWDWCLRRLMRHLDHGETPCPDDCDPWIGARLGRLAVRLIAALATPSATIPNPVATASPTHASAWRAAAHRTMDEAIELTEAADAASGAILRAIEPAMRADVDALSVDRPVPIQPVHGDFHVGQVLEWPGGLAVIDFDGNPALAGVANAIRQPVERDIAQMAASLDHLGRVADRRTAGSARSLVDEWIARARRDFLDALDADPARLTAFEVEQECRELVYAGRVLPPWRYAPLATLRARYGG